MSRSFVTPVLVALAGALFGCAPQDSLVQAQSLPPETYSPPAPNASAFPTDRARKPEPPASYSPVQGLDIEDIVVGSGREAKNGDRISVLYLYEGTLEDGSVFDGTAARNNQPTTFRIGVGQLIKGWELGLPGMRVGGKRKLTIAPELAYGRTSPAGGGKIPPGSTLIFVVELVDVL